jgi:hypothetical protein
MSNLLRIWEIPSTIATDGSLGVEGTLKKRFSPVSASEIVKSVNVPPTSIPIRYFCRGALSDDDVGDAI